VKHRCVTEDYSYRTYFSEKAISALFNFFSEISIVLKDFFRLPYKAIPEVIISM